MKKILILHTGGTIGMVRSSEIGKSKLRPPKNQTGFLNLVPELSKLAKVKLQVLDNIDSCNVTPSHWIRWFQALKKNFDHFDGFVFTHGTDTLAYTASALSFAMGQTNKPILFTGSQRPLKHIRTDARDNLINSVELACHGPPEIGLCMGNQLLRANRSSKYSSSSYRAFESFNFPALAKVGVQIEARWKNFSKSEKINSGLPKWHLVFDPQVISFKIFPGFSSEILRTAILKPTSRGFILEAFGSGNIPSLDDSILKAMELARSLKKPVILVSPCPHGRVDQKLYEGGAAAEKCGAISAGDMTFESTLVKLMHGLGRGFSYSQLSRYLRQNTCGERTS